MNSDLSNPSYEIIKGRITVPILANVPHSSVVIPEDIRSSLLLDEGDLKEELLCMTDWYVDELFACIHEMDGVVVRFNISRLVLDPERFLEDDKEVMSSRGMGVIYFKTSKGRDLRRALSGHEREDLIGRFYLPYHKAIEQEVTSILDDFGKCLIIDCHSFSSRPLPHESSRDPARPDICLGIDPYHTPAKVTRIMESTFRKAGLTTKQNTPFEGTYVPFKYLGNDSRVSSIMIEINRKSYMDEATGEKSGDFVRIQEVIANAVRSIC
jgi:N-formylglutamate deformylase